MKKLILKLFGIKLPVVKEISGYKAVPRKVYFDRKGEQIDDVCKQIVNEIRESGLISVETKDEGDLIHVKAFVNVVVE